MVVLQLPETGPLAFLNGHKLGLDTPGFVKAHIDSWTATQAPWIEVLAATSFGGVQGSLLGGLMGAMSQMTAAAPGAAGRASASSTQLMSLGGPLHQARNFAVMTGVNGGINTLMRRLRGVDDVQNSLVSAFGSGVCFSLVSGMGKPGATPGGGTANPLQAAFTAGVVFALFQGAFYKLGERFSKGKSKTGDAEYAKVKAMLSTLGMSKYESNFKKGLLADQTIALWDASTLAEVRVPPGPRLLILDHVDKYRHLLKAAGPLPRR